MRVLAIYLWDTRRHLAKFWEQAPRVVEHNIATLRRNQPDWMSIEIMVHLHLVSENEAPLQLARGLDYVTLRTTRVKIDDRGQAHLVAMNRVLQSVFGFVDLRHYDRVFITGQDWLLVNHYDANFFKVLEDVRDRDKHPRNAGLGLYRERAHYDYVGGTKPPGAPWHRFRHNPAFFFPITKWEWVQRAYSQTHHSYECELTHRLGQPGLFLAPNDHFYIRSPHYSWTEGGVDRMLAYAASPSTMQKLHERWRDGLS